MTDTRGELSPGSGTRPPRRRLAPFFAASAAVHLLVLFHAAGPTMVSTGGEQWPVLNARLVPVAADRESPAGTESPEVTGERVRESASAKPRQTNEAAEPGPAAPDPARRVPPSRASRVPSPDSLARAAGAARPAASRKLTAKATDQPETAARQERATGVPAKRMTAAPERPAGEIAERLTLQIREQLARHFSYPLLARRRGWEGRVTVALRVMPDGRIADVRVAHPSGHSVLDRAAIESFRRVAVVDIDPLFHSVELQLPVIYRLNGG